MKKFCWKRFGQVLKLDFAQGRSLLLWTLLFMPAFYLFSFWFAYNIGMRLQDNYTESYIRNLCEGVGYFGAITAVCVNLVLLATAFNREQQNGRRTALLMLPATPLEKILSRLVYVVVVSILAGCMFFVADGLHQLWLVLTDRPVVSAVSYFLKLIIGDPDARWFEWVRDLFINIGTAAYFLLGSLLFRKYQFPTMVLIVIAVSVTGYYLLNWIQGDAATVERVAHSEMVEMVTAFAVGGFCLLLAALFFYLSYRLFCRWQLTTRKYLNL